MYLASCHCRCAELVDTDSQRCARMGMLSSEQAWTGKSVHAFYGAEVMYYISVQPIECQPNTTVATMQCSASVHYLLFTHFGAASIFFSGRRVCSK